jgi:dipeptide transport system ATP-binding protein
LLIELQKSHGMALILITHDMAVVAETAEQVVVLYAGQQVEQRSVKELFKSPQHPYSEALLNALPERAQEKLLNAIPGVVPGQMDRPKGCLFNPVAVMHRNYVDNNPLNYRTVYCATILWLRRSQT